MTNPSRRERYDDNDGFSLGYDLDKETPTQRKVRIVVMILLGAWAAYLSWTTNTRVGYTVPVKILCSLVAALFGGIYLIFYYLMRSDCK